MKLWHRSNRAPVDRARAARADLRAFTMIEIAISLAVIGFALVAIVGILPLGMNVQKENREETVINQDVLLLMDAIRNGAQGYDDLTNYIIAITNTVTEFGANGSTSPRKSAITYWYTPAGSSTPKPYPLSNGLRIIGLLSTPTYVVVNENGGPILYSNHVTAYFRALSGLAGEKFPQTNSSVQQLGFTYRLAPELVPMTPDGNSPFWINIAPPFYVPPGTSAVAASLYTNAFETMRTNLHDLRLNFRWPLLPNNAPGPGQQAFRTLVGGILLETNEPNFLRPAGGNPSGYDLYFFQPQNFAGAQ